MNAIPSELMKGRLTDASANRSAGNLESSWGSGAVRGTNSIGFREEVTRRVPNNS